MYPEQLVAPMRSELSNEGFEELKSAEETEEILNNNDDTLLLVVNSVCGCAAGSARPGIIQALHNSSKKPKKLATVFAGVDYEATAKAREHLLPYPPSSPSIALFRGNELIHMIERHQIEGRPAAMIADHLVQVFEEYC